MGKTATGRDFAVAWAIAAALIVYGCLYPFRFRVPVGGAGAVATLLGGWSERPGRGDFLANILLYAPFGFFGVLAVSRVWSAARRATFVTLLGTALSVCVELVQYFDAGRQTTTTDVYANFAGTALGAFAGCMGGAGLRRPSAGNVAADPFPVLLLLAWVASRLYPFVPSVVPYKYWHALKPVVLHPEVTPYDLCRYAAVWLFVAALVDAVAGRARSVPAFALLAGGVLLAKVVIVGKTLGAAEVAGAGVALCFAAFGVHRRAGVVAALLCACIVAWRLEPFRFQWPAGHFGLVPFLGFMQGSWAVNTMSFLEKFSLYGGLIWLLARAGLRVWLSAAAVAASLLLTGLAETFLPGRSADVTDAVIALMAGAILGAFRRERAASGDGTGAAGTPAQDGRSAGVG